MPPFGFSKTNYSCTPEVAWLRHALRALTATTAQQIESMREILGSQAPSGIHMDQIGVTELNDHGVDGSSRQNFEETQ